MATRNSASSFPYAEENQVKFIHAQLTANTAKMYAPSADTTSPATTPWASWSAAAANATTYVRSYRSSSGVVDCPRSDGSSPVKGRNL